MTFAEFLKSCEPGSPDPEGWSPALRALRLDYQGDWHGAHSVAQEGDTIQGAWVHAYLHRKEGDLGNARYWYARAGRPECQATLEQEWQAIALALVEQNMG